MKISVSLCFLIFLVTLTGCKTPFENGFQPASQRVWQEEPDEFHKELSKAYSEILKEADKKGLSRDSAVVLEYKFDISTENRPVSPVIVPAISENLKKEENALIVKRKALVDRIRDARNKDEITTLAKAHAYFDCVVLLYAQQYEDRKNSLCQSKFNDYFSRQNGLWTEKLLQVFFDSGESTLDQEDLNRLKDLADNIKQEDEIILKIVGRTDQTGNVHANMRLAEHRAKAVRNILLLYGIDNQMMNILNGHSTPRSKLDTTGNSPDENRRVDVIVKRQ